MRKLLFVLLVPVCLCSFGSRSKQQQPQEESMPQYQIDYNAGVAAQQSQNYEMAIDYYLKALDQKSDFSDAWNNLAFCNRMIAKSYLVKAGDAYDKALKYTPNHPEALEYQGEYYVTMGQITKAYRNYKALKEMNSEEAAVLKEKLDAVLKQSKDVLKSYSP